MNALACSSDSTSKMSHSLLSVEPDRDTSRPFYFNNIHGKKKTCGHFLFSFVFTILLFSIFPEMFHLKKPKKKLFLFISIYIFLCTVGFHPKKSEEIITKQTKKQWWYARSALKQT